MSKTIRRKSSVSNSRKSKRNANIWSARNKLPECDILSQFGMTDNNIGSFKRYIQSPMDCFINALQLMGLIDVLTGNMVRISCAGQLGFTKPQIEKVFILYKGHNFDFKSTGNFDEFSQNIENNLQKNHAVFAGYTGHVFILARLANGDIMYIDPQINEFCNVNKCQDLIRNGGSTYYLLFHSKEKLNQYQLESIGFKF